MSAYAANTGVHGDCTQYKLEQRDDKLHTLKNHKNNISVGTKLQCRTLTIIEVSFRNWVLIYQTSCI